MSKPIRLDKYLSTCGIGTRSAVKKLLRQNLVTVDDEIQRNPGFQVDPEAAVVTFQGETLRYQEHVYVMLHKPEGVISATEDRWHDTVVDLLEGAYGERQLSPVGRLDRDTTGLLLLTDDGALAHELLSPRRHVDKVYQAVLNSPVTDEDIEAFKEGIVLSDFTAQPAELEGLSDNRARVTLTEGKFHQVKRMFEARGKQVLQLHRHSMGPLVLDAALQPGDWRELTDEEITALQNRD